MEGSSTIDSKSALHYAYKRSTVWVKAQETVRNTMVYFLDPSTSLREGRDDSGGRKREGRDDSGGSNARVGMTGEK